MAEPLELDTRTVIHLDNAATSFPKPPGILERALEFYRRFGVNPGRSGSDMARVAGAMIDDTRADLALLFNVPSPERVIFTANATDALNIVLSGLLCDGDHVIATEADHNAIIRPLNHLARDGRISVDFAPVSMDGYLDPDDLFGLRRSNTRLVVMTHASNVTGAVQPVAEVGAWCRQHDLLFILDAAQTAGLMEIDMEALGADALAFTGHKSLLAAPGIGGLCLGKRCEPKPVRFGGTGVDSGAPLQPDHLPVRLEAGTANIFAIAALRYALEYLRTQTPTANLAAELALLEHLQDGLAIIPRLRQHGTRSLDRRMPVLVFTVDGLSPALVGERLDVEHNIIARTGLHCAPRMHQRLGTMPDGGIRISPGHATTVADIDQLIAALNVIAGE